MEIFVQMGCCASLVCRDNEQRDERKVAESITTDVRQPCFTYSHDVTNTSL
jgi:hypothetical protein